METRSGSEFNPKILQLNANNEGSDYLITDLHGCYELFQQALQSLSTKDRLFVIGDMLDRKPDGLAIIEHIKKINESGVGPKIYCTVGNHEKLCLDSIDELSNIIFSILSQHKGANKKDLMRKLSRMSQLHPDLSSHFKENGGEWLLELFKNEFNAGLIYFQNEKLIYASDSKILFLKQFISKLPFIINVKRSNKTGAFNVVHAALPVSQDSLLQMIRGKASTLIERDLHYSIWTRPVEIENDENKLPQLTYAGHTVIIDDYKNSLRLGENLIDFDVAVYSIDALVRINHTQQIAEIIGDAREEIKGELENVVLLINNYFHFLKLVHKIKHTDHIKDLSQFHNMLVDAVTTSPAYEKLYTKEKLIEYYFMLLSLQDCRKRIFPLRSVHSYRDYKNLIDGINGKKLGLAQQWNNVSKLLVGKCEFWPRSNSSNDPIEDVAEFFRSNSNS